VRGGDECEGFISNLMNGVVGGSVKIVKSFRHGVRVDALIDGTHNV